jgi:hypothetical protein
MFHLVLLKMLINNTYTESKRTYTYIINLSTN